MPSPPWSRKRETSMSTGIGFGIGIPHASTDLIHEVVGALGRSRKGVNFDALDNQPVNLVMLFLVPQGQFQKHLHTLAKSPSCCTKRNFVRRSKRRPMPRRCTTSSRRSRGRRLSRARRTNSFACRSAGIGLRSSFNSMLHQLLEQRLRASRRDSSAGREPRHRPGAPLSRSEVRRLPDATR